MAFFKTFKEKEQVRKQLRKGNLVPFLKYLLYRSHLSRFFRLKRKHYTMRVWHAPLAFWFWTHEGRIKEDESFLEHFLKPGNTMVDCGAHLGTLAMTGANMVGTNGNVIACEMHPRTFLYLKQNVIDNGYVQIRCMHTAIGNKIGSVQITDSYISDMNHILLHEDGTFAVPMTTVDTITHELGTIDLLKLDVEGYELQALEGAKQALSKTKAVYFESAESSFDRYGYALKDIIIFLRERGFTCYTIENDQTLRAIEDNHHTKTRYENILALKDVEEYYERLHNQS